jgi:TonB family protein
VADDQWPKMFRSLGEESSVEGGYMEQLMFSSLPSPKSRWKTFATSWGIQSCLLLFLVNLPLLFPGLFSPSLVQHARYVIMTLVPIQATVPHQSQPVNSRLIARPTVIEETSIPKLAVPRTTQKRLEPELKAPELNIESKLPDLPRAPELKVVATNTFSAGSSMMPTTNKPARAVQTGGFGEPNGIPASENHRGVVDIGQLGSFDLPNGAGHGNGLGGAQGTAGVLVSAGFGNGVAVGSRQSGGMIKQSGFDSHQSVSEPRKIAVNTPPTTPVEIVFKPKPDYTDEGRELKIDGEVRLEVLFATDGRVRVIKVVRGLGHGLDEQAVRAAEQIRFKPALREGQPVDSTAVVHIVFQLVS